MGVLCCLLFDKYTALLLFGKLHAGIRGPLSIMLPPKTPNTPKANCTVTTRPFISTLLPPSVLWLQVISCDWVCERWGPDVPYAAPAKASGGTCTVNIHPVTPIVPTAEATGTTQFGNVVLFILKSNLLYLNMIRKLYCFFPFGVDPLAMLP